MLKKFILFIVGYCIFSNNLIALKQQPNHIQNVKINNDAKYNYKLQQNNNVLHLQQIKQYKVDNTIKNKGNKDLSASNLNIKYKNTKNTTQKNNDILVFPPNNNYHHKTYKTNNDNLLCVPKTHLTYKKYYNNTDWVCDNQRILK